MHSALGVAAMIGTRHPRAREDARWRSVRAAWLVAAALLVAWGALGGWGAIPAAAAQAGGRTVDRAAGPSDRPEPLPAVERIVATVYDLRHDSQTERALEEKLREQVLQKAREWSGQAISPQQIVHELLWLRSQEGVQQTRRQSTDPLTGRVTVTVELTIPLQVVQRWIPQLQQRYQQWHSAWLSGFAATAGLWLATLAALVVTDRLTGGYRRTWLIPGAVLVAAGLTAAGWWYFSQVVLTAPYAG